MKNGYEGVLLLTYYYLTAAVRLDLVLSQVETKNVFFEILDQIPSLYKIKSSKKHFSFKCKFRLI